MRVIGLDVSRTFAEVAYLEDGIVRPGGRVGLRRETLDSLANGRNATHEVVLEATTARPGSTGGIRRRPTIVGRSGGHGVVKNRCRRVAAWPESTISSAP